MRLRRSIARLLIGGEWALSLPERAQLNLRWFWFDGFFAAGSDNIIITYLVLYLLALGATNTQIGLMSSLSSLCAALVLLPGAMMVERFGRRKQIAVFGGGGVGRLMLLLLTLIPLAGTGPSIVYLAIGLSVIRDTMNNLSFPAWMAITADIVPLEGRGRYFASRNIAMGIAGMGVTLLAGEVITRLQQPAGYQLVIGGAFVLGILSTFSFSRLQDPCPAAPARSANPVAPKALLRDLVAHPAFLWLAITSALWNFSLNIAGPFFNVYLVQNLKATATMVGFISIASSLASMLAQRKLGDLADRWGARRLQLISGLLIPILPLAWAFVTTPWQIIPLNLLGGVLWGAFNLASFNFLLTQTPPDQRARYSAVFQIIVMVSLAAGAAVGSLFVTQIGYTAVFITSAAGRVVAIALFAYFVREPAPAVQVAG